MSESSIDGERAPAARTSAPPIGDDPIDLSILASHTAKGSFGLLFAGMIFILVSSQQSVGSGIDIDLLPAPLGWGLVLVALARIGAMSPRIGNLRKTAWVLFALSIPAWVFVSPEPPGPTASRLEIAQRVIWVVSVVGILAFIGPLARLIERMAEVAQEPELAGHARFRRRAWFVLAAAAAILANPLLRGVPLIPAVILAVAITYFAGAFLLLELLWRTRAFCQRHIRFRAEAESRARGSDELSSPS